MPTTGTLSDAFVVSRLDQLVLGGTEGAVRLVVRSGPLLC